MLNRFSKDIETVDGSLGSSLQAVNSSMATFFASVATVVFFSPPFIVPAVVIGYFYYRLGIGYLWVCMLCVSSRFNFFCIGTLVETCDAWNLTHAPPSFQTSLNYWLALSVVLSSMSSQSWCFYIIQVTVRAFSSERRFLDNLHGKIDITTKVWSVYETILILSLRYLQMWYCGYLFKSYVTF